MRKYLFLLINLLWVLSSQGQSQENKYNPKNYILPPPQVSNLIRLGEIPVEFSTGQANVEIPIFQIRSGKLNHNVSLRFVGDGCKVDRSNGLLGQDWTINVGGALNRTLRDKSDDYTTFNSKGAYYYKGLLQQGISNPSIPGASNLENSLYVDFEHDIFNYYCSGGLGSKFILKHTGSQFVPQHLIYSADSIEYKSGRYRIISSDGTIYVFGSSGGFGFDEGNNMGQNYGYSCLWLAKIISSDLKDSICFKYDPSITYRPSIRETLTFHDKHGFYPEDKSTLPGELGHTYGVPNVVQESFNSEYHSCYLSEIIFRNGKMKFNRRTNSKSQVVLDNIQLLDNMNSVRRIWTTYMNNFKKSDNSLSDFLKLDSISFSVAGTSVKENYSFTYYHNTTLGFPEGTTGMRAKDWAGYYNGNSSSLIPPFMQINGWLGGNRKPNPAYALQGMLKTIVYPTKGSATFEYEGNTFDNQYYDQNATSNGFGPGLRVKRIYNLNRNNDTLNSRVFEYLNGYLNITPTVDKFASQYYYQIDYVNLSNEVELHGYRERKFYDSFLSNISSLGPPSISYGRVKEYQGTKMDNIGYKEYFFSSGSGNTVIPIPNIPYTVNLNLFQRFAAMNTFEGSDNIMRNINSFTPFVKPILSKEEQFENANNVYKLVRSTLFNYQLVKEPPIHEPVIEKFHFTQTQNGSSNLLMLNIGFVNNTVFFIDSNNINIGLLKPIGEEKKEIFDADTVTTKVDYAYASTKQLNPSSSISISSEENTEIKKFKYANDYKNITALDSLTSGVKNLQKRNITAIPIEESSFMKEKGSNTELFVGSNINTFDSNNSMFKVSYKSTNVIPLSLVGTTTVVSGKINVDPIMKKDLEVLRYDSYNNPIEFKQDQGPITTYIWGYGGQYVVGKIANARYSEILTVLGSNAVSILQSLQDLNVSESQIRMTIDNIRKHSSMKKAEVITYTYDLFDGITSQTDARGIAQYYIYDGFQRLVAIKDFEGNILQTFCYNYAGQQVDCSSLPIIYYNNSQSATFTKNDCPSTQMGSKVIYNVPAGKYSSKISIQDADQKAMYEIQQNGQNYANQNGNCAVSTCASYRVLIPNSVLSDAGGSIAIGLKPCGSTVIVKYPYNSFEIVPDSNYPNYTIVKVCVEKSSPTLNFYRNTWDTNTTYFPGIQIESIGDCR